MEKKTKRYLAWLGGVGIVVLCLIILAAIRFFIVNFSSTSVTGFDYGMAMPSAMNDMAYEESASISMQKTVSSRVISDSIDMDDGASVETTERLIIKTGELSLVVQDVRLAVDQVISLAEKSGGFVVESTVYEHGLAPYATVRVRVPAKDFDGSISQVTALGSVESESVTGTDVTEEFVDLDAQLGNLRAAESQFLTIMERAVEIEDVLAVQRELTNVRRDIERIEGRMKYLKQSADLSTLTVHLSTDPSMLPVVDNDDSWKPLAIVKDAIRSLRGFGIGLVNFMIWVLVFIPVWVIIALVIWGVVRKVKKK
ncbi:DUF4349 domain-containing protein [Patescibacteria group bacterium]|nr:DUF4349 domain-containing protein [Patescibacteria group bacterium]MBU1721940.1 DUF4349 domain-containing protein [Patescibacteria group bacterium]MBU1901788.1 DUF4349 domain-containing protein [Patescibacteria group bacterium]